MNSKRWTAMLRIAICLTPASPLFGQSLQRLPDHNLFPPGSASNPIYVAPVTPPPAFSPPPLQPAPQINIPPRDSPYPKQERLAPRTEFEEIKFISTEPYPYLLSKGDMAFPYIQKSKLPPGKTRVVIGKTKHLATSDKNAYTSDVSEIWALVKKHHADEIVIHGGRKWTDGEEVLVKFVVWK